jgi:hypothetical protein
MAVGLGNTFRKGLSDFIFRRAAFMGATHTTTTFYISLHTGDPGPDGQTSNEVSGNGYARVAVTLTSGAGFDATTTADPAVTQNTNVITFPTASGGNWGTVSYFGIWTHATNTAASDFVGRAQLTSNQTINDTNTASFAIGALTHSFDGNFTPT